MGFSSPCPSLFCSLLLFPYIPFLLPSPSSFSALFILFHSCLLSPFSFSVLSDADISYPGCDRDQMAALDTLAAYYVQQARTEKNKELRKEYFAQVGSTLTPLVSLFLSAPQAYSCCCYRMSGNRLTKCLFFFLLLPPLLSSPLLPSPPSSGHPALHNSRQINHV